MNQGPAFENTDNALPDLVLAAIRQCAASWEPGARILGNVRACDVVRALDHVMVNRELMLGALDDCVNGSLEDGLMVARDLLANNVAPEELLRAQEVELAAWRACARYDPLMSGGGQFKGWDRPALDMCRKQFIEQANPGE